MPALWQQLVDVISNAYFYIVMLMIVFVYIKESERSESIAKMTQDMQKLNDQWERDVKELRSSFEAEKQQMHAHFQEQIKTLQDAEEIIWIKLDPSSERSHAASKRNRASKS